MTDIYNGINKKYKSNYNSHNNNIHKKCMLRMLRTV